jgi:predicted transcriptional regulator
VTKGTLPEEYFASHIGKKIKQFREESGRSMNNVAGYLDKSRQKIGNYEKRAIMS